MNNMIDFKKYVDKEKKRYGITDNLFMPNLTTYLVSNKWFGCTPTIENNSVFFNEVEFNKLEKRIATFLENYNKSGKEKTNYLLKKLSNDCPKTSKLLRKYSITNKVDEEVTLTLVDFLYSTLSGEIDESTDKEIALLMDEAFDELPRIYSTICADFINWTHEHVKTVYKNLYYINEYSSNDERNTAYDPESYLEILYHLFNEDYIEENDMYCLAANSKNYVDTWLFLSMHFLCALRNSDLVRIPHPRLPLEPEEVLNQVNEGTFSSASAKAVIYSIIWELNTFMLTPNKTQGTSGVASIKLHIPVSVETHIGTLFAIAEAHFQLSKKKRNTPLIRSITSYEQISRYMGEEIGDLFLESNFRCKAANKSYMQMIYLLTDDILGVNDDFRVKGYMLAALARSHKSEYGDFAKTTSIYLKDAKMSGYTPEFVARELFERGVLSTIPSMLLKMIAGKEYSNLSIENQTKIIQELNMSPLEVENVVYAMQQNVKNSKEIVKTLYSEHSKEDIIEILHKIGNGEATSKSESCMCLMTAMGKLCPKLGHSNCTSCEYEISTKTTMFLMVKETQRLQELYKAATSNIDKARYKAIAKDVIVPSINEMLSVMKETYGSDSIKDLEEIIREKKFG